MRQRAFSRHDVAPAPRARPGSLLRLLPLLALTSLAAMAACRERVPDTVTLAHLGLALAHPASLELPMPLGIELPLGRAGSAIARHGTAREPTHAGATGSLPAPIAPPAHAPAGLVPYHVELRARHTPGLRLEIFIDHRPPQPRMALALARSLRHGASLVIDDVRAEQIAGRRWQRTRFSHASSAGPQAGPSIGIEYAAVSGAHLYRVTAHGPTGAAEALAERVAPTLRLEGSDALPLWPLPAPLPGTPDAVQRAAEAVVIVVAADIATGDAAGAPITIQPVATGSGIAIDPEGHVLTSAHTLHDEQRDAPHDLFLVAHERAGVLVFVCAGLPGHATLDHDLDLALARCDLDLSGGALAPAGWPALPAGTAPVPSPGNEIWVLGRAVTADGALVAQAGRVVSTSGPDPAGADLVTIDVPVVPGMSGGAVVDAQGTLLGVVQGYRERFQADRAGVRSTGRVGLMRPVAHAQALPRP